MIRFLLPALLAISACSHQADNAIPLQTPLSTNENHPQNPRRSQQIPEKITPPPITQNPTTSIPLPTQGKAKLAYHHTSRNGIVLSLVSFDDRDYQLQVADQSHGPMTHWNTSKEAARALNGVAAINGGFFTPEGKPLGLVVTHGERRGGITHTSLGSGIFLTSENHNAIVRRETYTQSPTRWGNITHLLQSGPMLTENSKPVSGLSKKNHRPRSFIAWDGNHHWAIGYAEPCTLDGLARAISGRAPAEFPIRTAINLDGGRSSDLWVSGQVSGKETSHRGFLNKPVRNFLVIVPK